MKSRILRSVACLLVTLFSAPVTATVEPHLADQLEEHDRYEFTFTPGVWVPRVLGDVGLGFDTEIFDLTLEESFDLDNSEPVFNAELAMLKNDLWQVEISGFDFSSTTSSTFTRSVRFGDLQFNPGDAFNASVDLTSAVIEMGYWFYDACRIRHARAAASDDPNNLPECRVDLRFGSYVAMRYLDLDQRVEIPGEGFEEAGGEWVGVLLGGNLKMRYELPESFPVMDMLGLSGSVAVGPAIGGDGGAIAHVRATITAYINENIGLNFGYRLIHAVVENDDYEFNGGLQGLFFAVTLEF